jgi:hypothetical protein
MEESKDFYDPQFKDLNQSRNAYLNRWQLSTDHYRQENKANNYYWGRTTM